MEAFLQASAISHSAPGSENFNSLQEAFSALPDDRTPNVIVLPETPEQVAAIVKKSLALNQDIVVRGGGHDTYRRWNVSGATLVDLRNLNQVSVDARSQTARVSGGATSLQLLKELKEHGFHAATGGCGTVGYAGWALAGGMGPLMNSYGLGSDQIIGARIVNARGELDDADERLLKGLRGGGGSLAIVTQLVIKIYPINEIQAGMLILDSLDMRKAVSTFFTGLADLMVETGGKIHGKLAMLPAAVIALPGLGLVSAVTIIWNGPADEESKQWITRIGNLAPLMPGAPGPWTTIASTTLYDFMAYMTSVLVSKAIGVCHSVSVTGFTPEVISNLAKAAALCPTDGFVGGLYMHILRSESPSCSTDVPDSVLPYRTPHVMLELLGFGQDDKTADDAAQWALDTRHRFADSKDSTTGSYLPLTAPEFLDLSKTYGDDLTLLRQIKAEVDPNNVFKHSVPQLN